MFLFISADVTPCFSCPTFPSCHVPSPPFAHADNEMARCVHEDTHSVLVYATSHFRACLFIFILFLGDLASHAPPFRRVRHSHCMRTSHGMPRFSFRPRYRIFRTPSCFWRWRGVPSCVLSPPSPPWVFCACESCPHRALIFAHVMPAFGVLRQCPKNATNCYYMCARDSRFGPLPNNPPWPIIASPGVLLCRAVPCAGCTCTKNLVDVQPRHYFPKILKI
jgi:hypothetical protein